MSTASPLVDELEDEELPFPFECPLVLATPLPLVPFVFSAAPNGILLFMWFFVGVSWRLVSPNKRSCESDLAVLPVPGNLNRNI